MGDKAKSRAQLEVELAKIQSALIEARQAEAAEARERAAAWVERKRDEIAKAVTEMVGAGKAPPAAVRLTVSIGMDGAVVVTAGAVAVASSGGNGNGNGRRASGPSGKTREAIEMIRAGKSRKEASLALGGFSPGAIQAGLKKWGLGPWGTPAPTPETK